MTGPPRAFTILTAFILALSAAWPRLGVAQSQSTDAALSFAAVQILKENHIDKPDPVRLLVAGLNAVRQELTKIGIAEPLADIPTDTEGNARTAFQARLNQAAALAQGKLSPMQLQYAAVQGMIATLGEPTTSFLTSEQMAEIERRARGEASYVGIGMVPVSKEGRAYIWRVVPGAPAARAGLQVFDRLLAIDGQSVEGMTPQDISRAIRGPQGTQVSLQVQRPGQATPLTLTITREPISLPPLEQRTLEGGIGYITLWGFEPRTGAQTRRVLDEMRRQGVRSLILDLRGIAGGRFVALSEVAATMLPTGVSIYRLHSREGLQIYVTQGSPVLDRSTPIVFLVNADTTGLAALLAAAAKDQRRATLIGTQSGPVGVVGQVFTLPGNAGIWVTTGRATTGTGASLVVRGVEPDVNVDLTVGDLDRGIDAQLQRGVIIAGQGNR